MRFLFIPNDRERLDSVFAPACAAICAFEFAADLFLDCILDFSSSDLSSCLASFFVIVVDKKTIAQPAASQTARTNHAYIDKAESAPESQTSLPSRTGIAIWTTYHFTDSISMLFCFLGHCTTCGSPLTKFL